MKSIRFLDRRLGFSFAAVGVLFGMVAPSLLPAFASAATLSSRSMAMSSSASAATGVSYDLTFTAGTSITSGGGVAIEYCSNSPLIGDACTAPTGFDASAATLTDVKVATTSLASNKGTIVASTNHVVWTAATGGTFSASQSVEIILAGITNPSTANSNLYARVTTYTNTSNLGGFTGGATLGTYADYGAIATSITNSIGVSAAVLETMTFCVSGVAPTKGCGTGPSPTVPTTPSLTLGHGSPLALDASEVDTGTVYAQLSTNAASGAIVTMTNDTGCGGLKRTGATGCDIPAIGSTATAIPTLSTGGFGLNISSSSIAQTGAGEGFGTITPAILYGNATSTNYGMDSTAVSGPYGDPIFSSTAPVANLNVPLQFGAAAATTTPAGLYKANMNLIATGTY